jgi:hypothetical protein
MIFNDDFLFIHVPKTAGMSISDSLIRYLRGQVYYAVQDNHARQRYEETILIGKRHQTLVGADKYFEEKGLEHRVCRFKFIMAMVRNPYEMEVSRFHYLQKGHKWDNGHAQDLAMSGDFPQFVAGSKWWFDFKDYYTLDGRIPDNLFIVRFEAFYQTMALTFGECFKEGFDVARVNVSRTTDFKEYYTEDTEVMVYKKYQWLFDNGYYSREIFPSR